MATMREIKSRKTSIESTQKITKAMKLVSTVKLQKSRAKAESTKSYFGFFYAGEIGNNRSSLPQSGRV